MTTYARKSTVRVTTLAAAALAITGVGLLAPATAAPLAYTCTLAGSSDTQPLTVENASNAPATMYVGQKKLIALTSTLILPTGSGGDYASGTIVAHDTFGSRAVTSALTVPKTLLPDTGNVHLVGTGTSAYRATAPGTIALRAGKLSATFNVTDPDGHLVHSATVDCAAPVGVNTTFDTIRVKKDRTKTKVAPKQKGRKILARVTVKGRHGGKAPGKVTVTVMRGKRTVEKKRATLNKHGKIKVRLPKALSRGTYTVKVKYAGKAGYKPSQGKHKIRVR